LIVIYAEKASLAKAIDVALKAGNRIAHPKEPTIGHYELFVLKKDCRVAVRIIRLIYFCLR